MKSFTRLLVLIATVAGLASGQIALTLTGPARQGTTVPLILTLAGSAGASMAGIQWTATPADSATITSVVDGAAATAATLTPWCGTTNFLCVLIGFTSSGTITMNTMADGPLATLQLAIPATAPAGPLAVPLTGIIGATAGGLNVPGLASGAAFSVTVLSPCDVNGDGLVNAADVQAMITGLLGGSCPLSSSIGGCSLVNVFAVIEAVTGKACTIQYADKKSMSAGNVLEELETVLANQKTILAGQAALAADQIAIMESQNTIIAGQATTTEQLTNLQSEIADLKTRLMSIQIAVIPPVYKLAIGKPRPK
jgi:hypothetical protein